MRYSTCDSVSTMIRDLIQARMTCLLRCLVKLLVIKKETSDFHSLICQLYMLCTSSDFVQIAICTNLGPVEVATCTELIF